MFAIVSDIHGNLEAFTVVLDEIERRGIEHIICLGDVVGYGPNPMECLDLVMSRCRASLMGNHDFACFYEPYNFNSGAESACFWTRNQFENDPDPVTRAARWKFLGNLPVRVRTNEFVAVHASPRRPVNEYIFPDDIYTNPGKFVSIFERFDRLCFVGHTHVPGVFLEGPDFYSPDELDYRFDLSDEKAIINVGSVGQPRDRDPRSSFVIVHTGQDVTFAGGGGNGSADEGGTPAKPQPAPLPGGYIEFVRLPYDVDSTVRKVEQIAELDNFLGTRLLDGR
jgi:diadenosine tetraphosphatase ApaH/serine/threonine PP2A family protein phosphatase